MVDTIEKSIQRTIKDELIHSLFDAYIFGLKKSIGGK